MYSLTVLVPAFNEEKTIYQSLESLSQIDIFEKALVLNDGSTDSTINEVNKIIDIDKRFELINFQSNNGKGAVLQNSKNFIDTDYVVIHDADLEYDPKDLIELYDHINGKNIILGSRFIGDKERLNGYLRTNIANRVMSLFFSIVNYKKCTDIATCYKMIPSDFFTKVNFKEKGFSIEVEMLSKFLKYSRDVVEVPISYSGRSYEEGKKIKIRDGFLYLINTLKYKFFN